MKKILLMLGAIGLLFTTLYKVTDYTWMLYYETLSWFVGWIEVLFAVVFLIGLVWLFIDYRKDTGYENRISVEWFLLILAGILPLSIVLFPLDSILYSILSSTGIYYSFSMDGRIGVLTFLALLLFIIFSILFHIYLIAKLWGAINDGESFISPSAAVGLHFIPILGVFWAIIVWAKYPSEYNKYIERNNLNVKPMSSILFILYGLLNLVPFVGFFLLPLVLRQGLNAVNNLLRVSGSAVSKRNVGSQPNPVLQS